MNNKFLLLMVLSLYILNYIKKYVVIIDKSIGIFVVFRNFSSFRKFGILFYEIASKNL